MNLYFSKLAELIDSHVEQLESEKKHPSLYQLRRDKRKLRGSKKLGYNKYRFGITP